MKKTYALTLLTLFPACSKEPQTPAPAPQAIRASVPEALDNTERHHTETILAAAAARIRRGEALTPEATLRCWQNEESRPKVRELCLLAWSIGEAPAPGVEGILHQAFVASPSRELALAIARHQNMVRDFAISDLMAVLGQLADDPPWLRARLLLSWLRVNREIDGVQSHALWNALALPAPRASDPLSLGLGYEVAKLLPGPQSLDILASYCPSQMSAVSASRCLRFLTSVPELWNREELPLELRPLIPRRYDDSWLFFSRSFPERSLILEHYL